MARRIAVEYTGSESSTALHEMGQALEAIGDSEGARDAFQRAIAQRLSERDEAGTAPSVFALGKVALSEHRFAEADECFTRSLELANGSGDVRGQGLSSMHLAMARLAMKRNPLSILLLADSALTAFKQLKDPTVTCQGLHIRGHVWLIVGRADLALYDFTDGLALVDEIGPDVIDVLQAGVRDIANKLGRNRFLQLWQSVCGGMPPEWVTF
jgi:tetratricopeptide (TPR) repeat protein